MDEISAAVEDVEAKIRHWCPHWELMRKHNSVWLPHSETSDFRWTIDVDGEDESWQLILAARLCKDGRDGPLLWFLDYETNVELVVNDALLRHAYPIRITQFSQNVSICEIFIDEKWRKVRLPVVRAGDNAFPPIEKPTPYHSTPLLRPDDQRMRDAPWLAGRRRWRRRIFGY